MGTQTREREREREKEIHIQERGSFLAPREKHTYTYTYTYTRTLHTMHTYVGSRNREGARGEEERGGGGEKERDDAGYTGIKSLLSVPRKLQTDRCGLFWGRSRKTAITYVKIKSTYLASESRRGSPRGRDRGGGLSIKPSVTVSLAKSTPGVGPCNGATYVRIARHITRALDGWMAHVGWGVC